ncbi:MAG: RNA methyltransferase [Alphaproteobacteria bacterium]
MRGYFGIGVEGISKPRNVGALTRTAHAFGASFFFAVSPVVDFKALKESDTSAAYLHLPTYVFNGVDSIQLPRDCRMVGVELTDDAIDLPSFRHPDRAVYVLGPERGSLSPEMTALCEFVVKIPTAFCVNVGLAGAVVMYDRVISRGRFPDRPVRAGGPLEELPEPVFGGPILRKKRAAKEQEIS